MSKKYEKLKALLKELFQLDQPDLDFGLYRIMHAKAAEITQFLDRDLLPQVREDFAQYKTADKSELEAQLAKAIEQAQQLGADPESLPKVKELREKIASDSVDIAGLESEVYDHLYGFFRRYYSEGDFLSKRVYKSGVYAIPYEGEEVKLHWANADQYYIKTSEYLRDYAFRLHPDDEQKPMRVHFRLVDVAEGEHGNVKAAEGKDRIFILASKEFAALEDGEQGTELVLRFEYRPATLTDWPNDVRDDKKKPPTQKDMTELAVSRIMDAGGEFADWTTALGKPHEKADGELADYSRLRANLNRYVARNTFDYFIHKDLGGFLRRELDFYIKNEVMHLDDIEGQQAPRVEQYLSKIRVIRRIATKFITFLAHLEDFQKKLWLKKKFVVETNYCITLDRVPEELYPEIAANDAQREEWVRLFAINEIEKDLNGPGYSTPLTVDFLKSNSSLVLDTHFFSQRFVELLLTQQEELSGNLDGVIIHSDNFHALQILSATYRQRLQSIYTDPPYNAVVSEIAYKNNYKHSSWMSLIADRLELAVSLLEATGICCVTIDDYELHRLLHLVHELYGEEAHLATVPIRNNPSGRSTVSGFAINHEYGVFFGTGIDSPHVGRLPHSEEQLGRYDQADEGGRSYEWENFRKNSTASNRSDRPKQFYPIYYLAEGDSIRVPEATWSDSTGSWEVTDPKQADELEIWPIHADGSEKVWRFGIERARKSASELCVKEKDGKCEVYKRKYIRREGSLPRTWWDSASYSARDNGTRVLRDMLGGMADFDFPKAVEAVKDCLRVATLEDGGIVLDIFAGSGTTGHAVIELDRDEPGEFLRKFILTEMGHHFDTVLKPRLVKAIYSRRWSDGKPVARDGVSRGFKYLRLESYEDALNNLQLRRSKAQQSLLDSAQNTEASRLKEQYMLGYMLNVETEGSQSLLNVQAFTDPTAYKLNVKRADSDETREVNVDLLETFNWLIGLTVQHIAAPQCFSAKFERDSEGRLHIKGRIKQEENGAYWFRTVTGTTPDGRKTLVIWRKRPGGETPEGVEQDNLVLDEWFTKQGYSSKDSEFGLIYVNGTNNLENLRTPEDQWKVRLIEEDFHRQMFAAEGV